MTDYILSEVTLARYKRISTASIATQLYKRGLRNQFIQGVRPVSKKAENMVGQAFTLRNLGSEPIDLSSEREAPAGALAFAYGRDALAPGETAQAFLVFAKGGLE